MEASVRPTRRALLLAVVSVAASLAGILANAGDGKGDRRATSVEITGAIGPATSRHMRNALATARERRAEVVILRLNTPGGLRPACARSSWMCWHPRCRSSDMSRLRALTPRARAHTSFTRPILRPWLPAQTCGAATPVQIGTLPGLPISPDNGGDGGKDGTDKAKPAAPKDPMTAKVTNDAVAFIRSLAEMRGRNAEWAEQAVREASTLSAQAALERHVIDVVARTPRNFWPRLMVGRSRSRASVGVSAPAI